MSKFKDFSGKTLDEAIDKALAAFDMPREKLEIEIVSGGSSGIFGLMGKKAVIRARLRPRPGEKTQAPVLPDLPDTPDQEAPEQTAPSEPAPEPKPEPQARPKAAEPEKQAPRPAPQAKAEPQQPAPERPAKPRAERPREAAPRREQRPARPRPEQRATTQDEDRPAPRQPRVAPENEPDQETLNAVVREVVENILTPIIGETELEITNEPGRVKVLILDEENSGLIIGREGQTITSLQYIVNRIVARKLATATRVHLDAGDYRQRQDENLQRMALYLADKAKNQNRTQSTKPLSSYHRRLVHLALQDDEAITTSSKGEGPLKRVLIHPRRNGAPARG